MPSHRPRTGPLPGLLAPVLLVLVLLTLPAAAILPAPIQPNIVIVLADDMGWNDVGFHGGEMATPNLDALAYQGVILNKFYTAPICTPSRAALLTGKYPSNLGMQGPPPIAAGRPVALPLEEKILPQYLKEAGYSTHLVGKWHLGSYLQDLTPTRRGFDTHFGYWNGYIGHFDGLHSTRVGGPNGIDFHRNFANAWNETYGRYITDVLTDEAVRVVRNHGRKTGLLLVVTHAAPHTGNPGATLLQTPPRGLGPRRNLIRDPARRINADMVKELDDSVGRLVRELSDADMLSNSVFIFMSDNGAPSVDLIYGYANGGSNWPLRGEKVSAHEGGTRVNALVWSPLIHRPGRVHHGLFHMVDWLPTLISVAGGRLSGKVDGVDQWKAIAGLGEGPPPRSHLLVDLNDEAEAIIRGKWKLIKNYNRSSRYASADDYTGASGRGLRPYNTSEVWSSQAAVATRRAQNSITAEDAYNKLRREATVDCGERPSGPGVLCNPRPCLFDLEADPCERRDLGPTQRELAAQLGALLAPYRAAALPKISAEFDPRADPSCWGNLWTTWLEPGSAAASSCQVTTASGVPALPSSSVSFQGSYHGGYRPRPPINYTSVFSPHPHYFHRTAHTHHKTHHHSDTFRPVHYYSFPDHVTYYRR